MSRLIIKNLPNGVSTIRIVLISCNFCGKVLSSRSIYYLIFFSVQFLFQITEKRLREIFSEKGQITDVQLKYTKDGKFRKFGFVGYHTEQDASEAIAFFHNTCIDTSRINVEMSAALGAETKPQAWSKYAKDSSTYKKLHGIDDADESSNKSKHKDGEKSASTKDKKNRLEEIFGEHKNDPKFIEFMKVHGKANDIWDNDLGLIEQTEDDIIGEPKESKASNSTAQQKQQKQKPKQKQSNDDDESDDSEKDEDDKDDDDDGDNTGSESENADTVKLADQSISDLDYLKSLKSKTDTKQVPKDKEKKVTDLFTIKIREIPFKTKRKDVIKFFKPIKAFSIRLPTRKHGFCYVGFKTEKEFKKAMLKNRSFLNGKQVILIDFTEKNKEATIRKDQPNDLTDAKSGKTSKWSKQEEALKSEEDISESGRIFFRNLSYTVNEEQLQELFEKYGPITEISLPIDPATRKIKGFGTVTFVMPEHAVSAFSELDGSTFQGRLLHLIPGKSRDTEDANVNTEGMSYKQKKELELKKTAGSAHNWNTLFMGANAVANTLAKSYQTSKEQILDVAGGGSSAAVRLALGETELIIEVRKFLETNDVVLDAFNQAPKKRSKTVILVKNLPADTQIGDIQPLFAKFGLLGRIVLPPSGVTAIIEFLDSGEAKKAFSKLAYTKFKNMPLYLEWAPENTFKSPATKAMEIPMEQSNEKMAQEDDGKSSKSNPFTKGSTKTKTNTVESDEQEFENYVVNDDKPSNSQANENENEIESDADDTEPESGTTLFLRNLKFTSQLETIREHFKHIGKIHHIQIATKKDPSDSHRKISLGYGFIQFKQKSSAENALKTMQITMIDGNTVELKRSDRTLQ